MFDKIRRKATRAVKRAVGDAVEDEAERQVNKQVSKAKNQAQESIRKAAKKIPVKMISDFDKFQKSWEKEADKPEQSVLHFLIACYNYSKDPKIGEPMATVILSKKHNTKDSSSPTGLKLGPTNKRLMEYARRNPNITKSYLGANYKDDYKFSESKMSMALLSVEDDGKYAKIFIQSGGKDLPTPVQLAKNKNGQWKITEFSSIVTDCRKSESDEGDF